MRWQHIAAVLLLGTGIALAGTGCSSDDTRVQTAESTTWVKQQMQAKQKAINDWETAAAQKNASAADRAIAQLAINVLSKNIVSLIEKNGNDKPALLASVMKQEKQSPIESLNLPSLSSLQLVEKNQLDEGKTLYRLAGKVFTSKPDKLYPVIITVRVGKNGKIEYFEIDR
ncbi:MULTISPECIES: hypothetical protein [Aneurinibacillus]|uniref:Lipoprotein n=1 Tax=Aneurinibacillus thermoaerophilus TaxID=143495 RepID=A0A1G7WY55_ANETH|nr:MULTISPECIES: hypothetical protein [Aneurinibacillus]AMA73884.1 hypothetical protein ACH33_14250 [Aneurinibacillus sp. XH2]MED0674066.1 hypothetical protein [Aneurinibacillus thermoaerophilus]MED0678051.1 hypothetical protein [Aneurinibacillus thermoaerophilus]MED0737759.1 hypothetical protein [Aneurinibacillus thermoaerophilus]MED0755745.1 hypothetical protein [Aneurinibacillus thermoaerophilus]